MKTTSLATNLNLVQRLQFTRTLQTAEADVSSITRSGSTATVTTDGGHLFTTGQSVRVYGAAEQDYNGVWTITVTGSDTFTYTVAGTPTTPSAGGATAISAEAISIVPDPVEISSITRSGTTATVTTSEPHQLVTGQWCIIEGLNQADYNGTFLVTRVSSTVFTMTVKREPASPATGSGTCRFKVQSQQAIIKSHENNSEGKTVYIGPNSNADWKGLYPDQEYVAQSAKDTKEDMSDWMAIGMVSGQRIDVCFQ